MVVKAKGHVDKSNAPRLICRVIRYRMTGSVPIVDVHWRLSDDRVLDKSSGLRHLEDVIYLPINFTRHDVIDAISKTSKTIIEWINQYAGCAVQSGLKIENDNWIIDPASGLPVNDVTSFGDPEPVHVAVPVKKLPILIMPTGETVKVNYDDYQPPVKQRVIEAPPVTTDRPRTVRIRED